MFEGEIVQDVFLPDGDAERTIFHYQNGRCTVVSGPIVVYKALLERERQAELARQSGVPAPAIARIELGETPSEAEHKLLSEFFGLHETKLFHEQIQVPETMLEPREKRPGKGKGRRR